MGFRSSLRYRVRCCLKKKKGRKERTKKYKQTKKNNTIKEVTILVMVCNPAPPALPLPSFRALRERTPWCSFPAAPALRGPRVPYLGMRLSGPSPPTLPPQG